MAENTVNRIKCPHCGYEHKNWYDYVDPTEMEATFTLECEGCDIEFTVEMTTDVWFRTSI